MNEIEKLAYQLQEGRLVGITQSLLYPLLSKHIDDRLAIICEKYKGGQKDFISEIAEINYIRDLLLALQSVQKRGEAAGRKLNK